jgi:hypothetical protein
MVQLPSYLVNKWNIAFFADQCKYNYQLFDLALALAAYHSMDKTTHHYDTCKLTSSTIFLTKRVIAFTKQYFLGVYPFTYVSANQWGTDSKERMSLKTIESREGREKCMKLIFSSKFLNPTIVVHV